MRLSCVLLVAAATLVASSTALSSADQTTLLKVQSDNGKRLLRSVETADEDDSSDDLDEERVAAATLVASSNALSSADQTTLLKVQSDNGKRLLRSVETVGEDDSSDDLDEERGWNLGGLFGAQTAEEMQKAKVAAENNQFYKDLLKSASFRKTRFEGWQRDGVSIDDAIRFMGYHGKTEKKYMDVIEKYKHFRETGQAT
ncbi:hypothetical protein PHYBOEH_002353 [Phytophthora boehmeriae]|uniref:RxLR effector protein n=1 Tax=Phytophthora boehmeriae TaxID=109152 RepID=A0A8T1V5F9_9STRA|nr:hypothetical protein PHYBOEH_002353 [Phytophthora boehmeriae]